MGEAQAVLRGVDGERTKRRAIATTGMIGFVGLLAPHCIRLIAGPDHCIEMA